MKRQTKRPQVVIYARYSPLSTCDSIEKQFARLRAWCIARDYEVVGEYSDADRSGGTTEGREGLDAALAHVLKIRGILAVYDISRLSRRVLDGVAIAERLIKRRCGLMFLVEQMDTSTDFGMLMFQVQTAFAEYFRRANARRTSGAMLVHQTNGRRMGRNDRVPYGWRSKDSAEALQMVAAMKAEGLKKPEIMRRLTEQGVEYGRMEEDPEEQTAIARIVALDGAGRSLREICAALDEEGITRRGRRWFGAQRLVSAILQRAGA